MVIMDDIRFLIVDDYEFSKIFFENAVHLYDYQYSYVPNGQKAIEELIKNDFDIILMDIEMPVMNGIDATIYIRTNMADPKNSIPIVAITGHTDEDYLEDLKNYGFTDYISKMFTSESIFDITKKYVSKKDKFYSLKFLENSTNIDKKLENELVTFFVENTPKTVDILYRAFKNSDWKRIKDTCHKLSNQLNYFGLSNASILSGILEKTDFETTDKSDAFEMIRKIEKDTKRAVIELKRDFDII